jgi:hypothetical protein
MVRIVMRGNGAWTEEIIRMVTDRSGLVDSLRLEAGLFKGFVNVFYTSNTVEPKWYMYLRQDKKLGLVGFGWGTGLPDRLGRTNGCSGPAGSSLPCANLLYM